MKNNRPIKILTTTLFYISIILLFVSFNFQDSRTGGWYQQFPSNLNGKSIYDVFFLDSLTGWAVTPYSHENDTAFVIKTTNGGDNWFISNIRTGQYVGYNKIKFLNLLTGFTCGVSQSSGFKGLNKTTDGGYNWVSLNVPNPYIICYDMVVFNQDSIWVVDNESLTGGAFLTTNGGASWQQEFSAGTENPNKIYFYNSRIGFICNTPNGTSTRRTTDGGISWAIITPNEWYVDIYFLDSLLGYRAFGNNMYKTTNGGLNWTVQYLPSGGNMLKELKRFTVVNKDTIWACGGAILLPPPSRGILYRTTNGGNNWYYQIPDTTIHVPAYFYIKFINKNIGWAYGLYGGIHTTIGGDTTFLSSVRQLSNIVPNDFKLYQNYPNPFNPSTYIGYYIQKQGWVKLKIYDISGKEIGTLVNEVQSIGGYGVPVTLQLSSGVYFYKLIFTTKNGIEMDTKKMLMIK